MADRSNVAGGSKWVLDPGISPRSLVITPLDEQPKRCYVIDHRYGALRSHARYMLVQTITAASMAVTRTLSGQPCAGASHTGADSDLHHVPYGQAPVLTQAAEAPRAGRPARLSRSAGRPTAQQRGKDA